ncbi:MAG: hypothetical protein MJ180_00670 [Candidatus Gastranaerophilales bacterium]|nr:hypothetical protein [Candidatus Gastranaerophilales bacterium]
MKKILALIIAIFMFATNANAADMIKNYKAYTIIGHKVQEIADIFNQAIIDEKEIKRLKDNPNAYYGVYNDEHYYVKLYPANNNTNMYIVADVEYEQANNDMTKFFKAHNFKWRVLQDKEAEDEYYFDFIAYARTGNLDGLFIMPDFVKPLKIGMQKINDKISKNSKKTGVLEFENDTKPIDLTRLNTEYYNNQEAQIDITVNEYRLKNKENRYVHAFEYIIKNTASSKVLIDKVTSERVASLKDVTTQTFVDMDRLDIADTVGSLPPVFIATCGLSLIPTVANNIRLAKVAKESARFSHTLPEHYTLNGNSKMKVLVLKFKNDPKPLNFTVTRDGQKFNFSF